MNCLNSFGCTEEATELTINGKKCKNFCCKECYLIYKGEIKPQIPERKTFKDPDRQWQHDLYIWAMTGTDPRKPYIEPKKRGVKKGSIRGSYKITKKKRKLNTKICPDCNREFTTSNKNKNYCNNKCKQKAYRKRRKINEIKRKKDEFENT